MKKLYTVLASLACVASMSAAVPSTTIAGLSTNNKVADSQEFCLKSVTPFSTEYAAPRAGVPASESMFELDTTFPLGNNTVAYLGSAGWLNICMVGMVLPVDGKENTYTLSCFNPWSDVDQIVATATVDPETGILTIDKDTPVARVTSSSGDVDLYIKGAKSGEDNNIMVDPDVAVQFEFADFSLKQLTDCYFIAYQKPDETDGWYFMGAFQQSMIGYATAMCADTYTNGSVTRQRNYTSFFMPVGGDVAVCYNAFGFGQYEVETYVKYDAAKQTLTFDDQMIGYLYDATTSYPLYIGTEQDNIVVGDYKTFSDEYGSYEAVLFSNLLGIVTMPDGNETVQFNLNGYNADYSGPVWSLLYDFKEVFASAPQIEAEDANAPVEYFNLQGVKIANPENGIYVRRQGNKVSKVLVK